MTLFTLLSCRRNVGVLIYAVITMGLIHYTVPYSGGFSLLMQVVSSYDAMNYQHIIVDLTYLPRLSIAVVSGFGLAVAGAMMQYVLKNPIASPTTLGVAAGSEMGMIVGILFLPAVLPFGGVLPAFFGGVVATILVFLLSAKKGFAPLQMILAGMVVSLFVGSINTMLVLLHQDVLGSTFIWGAGALNQNGWDSTLFILPVVIVATLLLLILQRPLSALQFGDDVAASLGVNIKRLKILCLSLSILITSVIVSEVGVIGFIGVVAPAIARMLGARRLASQLIGSGVLGSMILLFTDLVVQPFSGSGRDLLPTGAMTALIGAPFLLWLLQQRAMQSEFTMSAPPIVAFKSSSFARCAGLLSVSILIVFVIATLIGQGHNGWGITWDLSVIELRFPRVLVALLAGIGLAIAGVLIQRTSNNDMASPEVLGISSGAALMLVVATMAGLSIGRLEQIVLGSLGAFLVAVVIWLLGRRHQFAPTQILLTGIALSSGLDACLRIALSSGQEEAVGLLTWLSGSTYLVNTGDVMLMLVGVGTLGGVSLLLHRWANIIELGDVSANSIGVDVKKVRLVLLACVALLTTLCTVIIGPLSFVGLLAPHMARSLSQYRAAPQMVVAGLLGGIVMVLADWIGRSLWYPWQFPAGLLASIIGGVYFLYLMRR
ncbi:Fe(3+)-hydroxamate ABC transporter permease FhuB [Vibrio sp.]|nr:Fe(3+)-hydroxamate ABC transporter permease FhuB [Vibrio sp.]